MDKIESIDEPVLGASHKYNRYTEITYVQTIANWYSLQFSYPLSREETALISMYIRMKISQKFYVLNKRKQNCFINNSISQRNPSIEFLYGMRSHSIAIVFL